MRRNLRWMRKAMLGCACFGIGIGTFVFIKGEACADENVGVVSDSAITTQVQMESVSSVSQPAILAFSKEHYEIPYHWKKTIPCQLLEECEGEYTITYTSSDKKIATVNENGRVKGIAEGTVTITASTVENPDITASYEAVIKKEKKGAHTEDGKVYCVDKDGERMIGYCKAGGDYYFTKKNSYAITKTWKYVNIDGKKYKLYFGANGKQKQDVSSLIGEQSSYKIAVNISKNTVIVYANDGKNGYCIPVKAMVCSCGIPGHSTRRGTYSYLHQTGKWHTLYYGTYGKYCTRISGPYLFHSVVYSRNGDSYSLYPEEYKKLGKAASHGCVRLPVKDAKWIYDRASKCIATLYTGKETFPLKKPKVKAVGMTENGNAYDPTDVDVAKK